MKNTSKQLSIPFPGMKERKPRKPRILKEPPPVYLAHPKFPVAEIELVYKSKVKACDRPKVTDSKSAYDILSSCWDDNKLDMVEQFNILFLNRANQVTAFYQMSTGGITGTVCDPRHAFVAALKTNSVSMILSHNHPSGNLRPSRADEELTTKFKENGKMLEVKVIDHIIMSRDGYMSFADEGIL